MKFTADLKQLISIHTAVNGVTRDNPVSQTTNYVLLEVNASGDILTLMATDRENAIKSQCPVTKGEAGSIAILSKDFIGDLRSLAQKYTTVTVETKNDTSVTIKSGHSRKTRPGLQKNTFPDYPDLTTHETKVTLLQKELLQIFKLLLHTISDAGNSSECGTYVIITPDYLEFIGTNRHKLAKIHRHIANPNVTKEYNVIINKRSLELINRHLCNSPNDTIEITLHSDRLISFHDQKHTLACLLLNPPYLSYDIVLSSPTVFNLDIDREEVIKCINIGGTSADTTLLSKWAFEEDTLIISSQDSQRGESSDEIIVTYNEPQSFAIGINSKFILDIITQLNNTNINIAFGTPLTPVLLNTEEDDLHVTYALMPMRLL